MTEADLVEVYTHLLWDAVPVLALDDVVRALVARDYAARWWVAEC